MVIRRSHFVSICLLALASSIALTEYITYSPTSVPDTLDEGLFTNGEEESAEKTDVNESEESSYNAETSEVTPPIVSEQQPANEKTTEKNTIVSKIPTTNIEEHKATITGGSTLTSLLSGLGFNKTDIHTASKSLSRIFKLKNLKAGQEILVKGKRDKNDELVLNGLEIKSDPKTKIVVSRKATGEFVAEKINVPIKKVMRSISGSMSPLDPLSSLKQCGVKPQIANEALRALSNVVNVKNSKSNIDFEFLYVDLYDMDGNAIDKPEPVYFSVLANGKICRVYKFNCNGGTQYIDSNGTLLNTQKKSKASLIQPISYSKITSKFGMRYHPISGRYKGHTGVDLSAHVGTPVRAASSGVITKATYYSGYGKYIHINHSSDVSTAYGHLSRIAVRAGQRVSQGQIIGYSGNSGYSTGPHLHYEVIKDGRFVNPTSFVNVKQEPARLSGKDLAKFNQFKKELNLQVVGLSNSSSTKKKTIGKLKKYS